MQEENKAALEFLLNLRKHPGFSINSNKSNGQPTISSISHSMTSVWSQSFRPQLPSSVRPNTPSDHRMSIDFILNTRETPSPNTHSSPTYNLNHLTVFSPHPVPKNYYNNYYNSNNNDHIPSPNNPPSPVRYQNSTEDEGGKPTDTTTTTTSPPIVTPGTTKLDTTVGFKKMIRQLIAQEGIRAYPSRKDLPQHQQQNGNRSDESSGEEEEESPSSSPSSCTSAAGEGLLLVAERPITVFLPERKRRRRVSPPQKRVLECAFAVNPYATPKERRFLANKLGLSPRQVNTWYHNKRARGK